MLALNKHSAQVYAGGSEDTKGGHKHPSCKGSPFRCIHMGRWRVNFVRAITLPTKLPFLMMTLTLDAAFSSQSTSNVMPLTVFRISKNLPPLNHMLRQTRPRTPPITPQKFAPLLFVARERARRDAEAVRESEY